MASLLCGSVSPTYSNLSSVAHHRSSWQASKDGRFEDAFNIENALMQQPSHIMTKHVSRWILMVSFSFWPYDQKREKCHFSDFVILTKKIANNVFCKHSHYNLQKILGILGTWISQIPLEMTDLLIYWLLTPLQSHTLKISHFKRYLRNSSAQNAQNFL